MKEIVLSLYHIWLGDGTRASKNRTLANIAKLLDEGEHDPAEMFHQNI